MLENNYLIIRHVEKKKTPEWIEIEENKEDVVTYSLLKFLKSL